MTLAQWEEIARRCEEAFDAQGLHRQKEKQ